MIKNDISIVFDAEGVKISAYASARQLRQAAQYLMYMADQKETRMNSVNYTWPNTYLDVNGKEQPIEAHP